VNAQPGQRVGEYVLQSPVGNGAFGEVWRAQHHVWSDQIVAVKIPSDPANLRSLQREGATIHSLVHPNIVRAIAFDPYAPVPYLAMEFVPGTSLRPLIQNKSLSVADAAAVMKQVLAGLKYAHEQNVIHRDIKPENILIHERAWKEGFAAAGVVKLTDFGLGRQEKGAANDSIAYSASMNSPAGRDIAGTLDYMAPEQRAGSAVDARADLYSCGVVFFEMLTGQRPAGTELPSDLKPGVPAAMDEIFRRSYSRLEKRYSSAGEFLAALSSATGFKPPPIPPPPLSPRLAVQGVTNCPNCRKPVQAGDQFCIYCGLQLVPVIRRCPKCGAYPDAADRFCMFCGQTMLTPMAPA
jgi:serine/threonine-protein kinase